MPVTIFMTEISLTVSSQLSNCHTVGQWSLVDCLMDTEGCEADSVGKIVAEYGDSPAARSSLQGFIFTHTQLGIPHTSSAPPPPLLLPSPIKAYGKQHTSPNFSPFASRLPYTYQSQIQTEKLAHYTSEVYFRIWLLIK